MSRYSILHITDAHFGQSGMSGRWPSIKAQFFADLRHVIGLTGGIDLVAFTGDIANRGAEAEYAEASKFMDELGELFLVEADVIPRFAAVPGNHDLERPSGSSLAKTVLERYWDAQHEQMLFSDVETNDLRDFSRSIFKNYAAWIDGGGHALTPVSIQHQGILPGDFAATDGSNNLKIGIVGLNSTFRHLSDVATEGSLTISDQQVQQACGGDLPKWSLDHDVSIALTHHPLSWLKNRPDTEDAIFNGASTTRLHLCGHLHLEQYTAQAIGTAASRLTHQGQSLFGLEQFPTAGGPEDRQHGYAVITIEKSDDKLSSFVWPRRGERLNDGTWSFDRHAGFGLEKNRDHSQPINLSTPIRRTTGLHQPREGSRSRDFQPPNGGGKANLESFLQEFKQGFMVAVIGDRYVDGENGQSLAFDSFKMALWDSLDTGEPYDASMAIDQLLHLSSDHSEGATRRIMASLSSPKPHSIEQIDRIIRSPWASVIYLSPLRDLENCPTLLSDKEEISFVDGTSAAYRLPAPEKTLVLRLSGPAPEEGSVTLRLDEVMVRAPENSATDWRRYAKQLLSRSPSVFLTDSVSSLSLWQWIADRNSAANQYRMPAFLVCPELPLQFRALLKRYDVKWIESTVADFSSKYLQTSRSEFGAAKAALTGRRKRSSGKTPLAIGALRAMADGGSRDYLFGTSPSWGDITSGYAARLSSQAKIMERLNSAPERSMILVKGTAGSGRSTSLMQSALDLQASHKSVAWVDPTVSKEKISQIVDQVIEENYDYVFVDDVDAFGAQAERLLTGLRGGTSSKRIVVAGVRSVRAFRVEGLSFTHTCEVGNLTGGDLDLIVKVLRKHRAMANRRQSDRELRELLQKSNGQLIVGMIQATSGVPFIEKISSECSQLKPSELMMYGCAALISAENESISVAQLQDAVGGNENESWGVLKALESSRLLQMSPNTGRYELRHRVIAEEVRSYLSKVGALATVVGGTLRAYAAAGALTKDRSNHTRRMLIRLLSHSYLIKTLGLPEAKIRGIYDSVEDILEDDFHYWLQRGAFEVEIGDLKNAMHDLKSASTTAGGEDDHKVLTEFAVLRLKIAADSRNSDAIALSTGAIEDLHKVIRIQGTNSPHTITILASAGVPWLVGALISRSDKRAYAETSLSLLKAAGSLMTTNGEVAQKVPPAIKALEDFLNEL
jgi:predicted MPP superfamily phosphohydrolase